MALNKTLIILSITLLFFVVPSCVSPNAIPIKTEIQGIRTDMNDLEKLADDLSVWRNTVKAETINYSGAKWVVIGTSVMALIFVGASLSLIKAFMRRGRLLTMLTGAVQEASQETIRDIKRQLEIVVDFKVFKQRDKEDLGHFAKKVGTFVKR